MPKYEHPAETLKGVVFAKKGHLYNNHTINASYDSKEGGNAEIIKEVRMRSPTDLDNRISVMNGQMEAHSSL